MFVVLRRAASSIARDVNRTAKEKPFKIKASLGNRLKKRENARSGDDDEMGMGGERLASFRSMECQTNISSLSITFCGPPPFAALRRSRAVADWPRIWR